MFLIMSDKVHKDNWTIFGTAKNYKKAIRFMESYNKDANKFMDSSAYKSYRKAKDTINSARMKELYMRFPNSQTYLAAKAQLDRATIKYQNQMRVHHFVETDFGELFLFNMSDKDDYLVELNCPVHVNFNGTNPWEQITRINY